MRASGRRLRARRRRPFDLHQFLRQPVGCAGARYGPPSLQILRASSARQQIEKRAHRTKALSVIFMVNAVYRDKKYADEPETGL
jgi:hypothetical protein